MAWIAVQCSLLAESLFDLGGYFQGERIEALAQVLDILQKLIVENHRGNSSCQASGGGQQRFGNARRDGTKASGAGIAQAGESVDDAPNRAEESHERRDRPCGREPRHAFFDAAHFFRGGHLHIGGDRLQAF